MTAATAAPGPGPLITGPGPGADADDTSPVTRAHFRAWEDQLAAESTCSHPVQLRSRTDMIDTATGELAPLYGQASVACGNRRETVCPACSAVYKRDARQVVRAGLAGGKGVPESIDTRIIRHSHELPGTGQALNGVAVTNYIAKYATKTLTAPGLPSRRLWAHMLGYGGYFLTKSRRYSVTFGQLRAARTEHRRALRPRDADRDAWSRTLDHTVVLVLPTIWTYEGIGRPVAADAELALAAAARAREHHGQADNAT